MSNPDQTPATPSAASIAWNALRDLTDPLGEVGTKILGGVRIYAQRQYEAGLQEGRRAPLTLAQLSAIARQAQIDYNLCKYRSFEVAFARGVEAAHGIKEPT